MRVNAEDPAGGDALEPAKTARKDVTLGTEAKHRLQSALYTFAKK
jgi:hypothetical protein